MKSYSANELDYQKQHGRIKMENILIFDKWILDAQCYFNSERFLEDVYVFYVHLEFVG